MRIISGAARGRNLYTLKGLNTRPTADRVKEAVFSVLTDRLSQARVLDAFAGSAALGLEALSRGAASALFFEADHRACQICRRNIDLCGLPGCRLIRGDCLKLLPRLRQEEAELRFDLVFADPPYNRGLLPRLLDELAGNGWLSPDGLVVAETTATDSEFAPDERWQVVKSSVYGSTAVHYCRLKPTEQAAE
ncbi:MAG: 16S rRNA (guanine(966)-N(2))-methyltransferase RsmD [Firmicutes bacterium]|nr:16S rRNA (guanine(966)-N(2))-methyltransferase RsmD [Bacillota bacterium]